MALTSFGVDFDCNRCETKTLFGKGGSCDEENKTCACPEGFSGRGRSTTIFLTKVTIANDGLCHVTLNYLFLLLTDLDDWINFRDSCHVHETLQVVLSSVSVLPCLKRYLLIMLTVIYK